MSDNLTIITEANTQIITAISDPDQVTVVTEANTTVISIVTEGPMGPPDTRARPSDIALNVIGEIGSNELLLRLELGANVTIVPARCRASAEEWPTSPATINITLESNGINRAVANVVFGTNSASFTFSNNLVLEPGTLRVLSSNATFDLKDFSITLSGDR
jgi:hypothetical protein